MPKSEELVLLGLRIKSLRESRSMTQEQLGFESGLDRTYVSDLERGNRNLSYTGLTKIAKGLNISISEMLVNIDEISPTN